MLANQNLTRDGRKCLDSAACRCLLECLRSLLACPPWAACGIVLGVEASGCGWLADRAEPLPWPSIKVAPLWMHTLLVGSGVSPGTIVLPVVQML